MPLDVSILDNIKVANPVQSFIAGQEQAKQIKQQEKQNVLSNEMNQQKIEQNKLQIEQERFNNLDAREKSRVTSEIYGAAQLKPYLDSGDTEGALAFLNTRRANLQARIANGENIDTTATDRAIELLNAGDVDRLKGSVDGMINFGEQSRILSRTQTGFTPAAVQIANEIQQARASGDAQRVNDLLQASKIARLDAGQVLNPQTGQVETFGGFNQSVAETAGQKRRAIETQKTQAVSQRPLPPAIQKSKDEQEQDLQSSYNMVQDATALKGMIKSGEIDLSIVANAVNKLKNNLAMSNAESINLERIRAFIEQIRNAQLRLNKGVQTEGDAQRALNEIISNLNDPNFVATRLNDIENGFKRGLIQRLNTYKGFLSENKRELPSREDLFGNATNQYGVQPQQTQQPQTASPSSGFKILRKVE